MYFQIHSILGTIVHLLGIFHTDNPGNAENTIVTTPNKLLLLDSFSWSDCGSGSESVKIKALTASPDPITIPGLLSLGFNITNGKDIISPVSLSLVVKKKISFVWIKIPCEDNVGSCHYKDACDLIPPECPESFIQNKIPCKCPVEAGAFFLPPSPTLNISATAIPHWLESGEYSVQATLSDKSGIQLVCLDILAKLKAK